MQGRKTWIQIYVIYINLYKILQEADENLLELTILEYPYKTFTQIIRDKCFEMNNIRIFK